MKSNDPCLFGADYISKTKRGDRTCLESCEDFDACDRRTIDETTHQLHFNTLSYLPQRLPLAASLVFRSLIACATTSTPRPCERTARRNLFLPFSNSLAPGRAHHSHPLCTTTVHNSSVHLAPLRRVFPLGASTLQLRVCKTLTRLQIFPSPLLLGPRFPHLNLPAT